MNPLFKAGLEIQSFLKKKKWHFCFIGGIAVIRWGEVRVTQDVDLSLFTGFGGEQQFITETLAEFEARVKDPVEFALQSHVLLIKASNGIDVDIALAGLPFERELIGRASSFEFEKNCSLITCSADDLIVLKAFSARAKDWADLEGVIIRQSKLLDWSFIMRQLQPLAELKEEPELLAQLEKLKHKFGRG